jgi:hypothetical protein
LEEGLGRTLQFGIENRNVRNSQHVEFRLASLRRVRVLGYPSQDAIKPTVAAAIVAVAAHPMINNGSGSVNSAMIDRRMVSHIIITITGTATTPFSTALQ